MRFFEKTKGAISLFLVIILVPMLTLSGLFVDASKINLGRAMAESAGDLTLNTALTNYDSDLKELYGLMATAQDTSDLFERLEDYYRTCIISSGVSEEDAETYVGEIMAQLGVVSESNDTADIMNMEVVDFAVEKYANANLANATILEKQIVDFMKYRAPINTGLSFVTSLKSFSTLSKQTELVEKKQEYYEAQQGVMANLKEAWKWIAEYNKTNIVQSTNYLAEIQSELGNMKDGSGAGSSFNYKLLHEWLVMDLYHVEDYIDYRCSVEGSNKSYNVSWNDQSKNAKKSDYIKTLPTASDIGTVAGKLKGALSAAEEIVIDTTHGTPYYDLQLLVQYLRNGDKDLEVYTQRMIEVHSWYLTLAQLYSNLDQYDKNREAKSAEITTATNSKADKEAELNELKSSSTSTGTSTGSSTGTGTSTDTPTAPDNSAKIAALEAEIAELSTEITNLENELAEMKTTAAVKAESVSAKGETKTVQQWYDSLGSSYNSSMTTFAGVASTFSTISIREKGVYDTRLANTESTVSSIAEALNLYLTDLEDAKEYLGKAIAELEAAKTALSPGGAAGSAKSEWQAVASDSTISGTNLAKQDQAELDQLDTYLTPENVEKLLKRLRKIEEEVGKAIDQLKDYKYCGVFIGEIDSYDKLENALHGKYGKNTLESVPVKEEELRAKATTWWNECWQDGGLDFNWVTQSGSQPDLRNDKCAMYSYLYSHFAAIVAAEGESKKDKDVGLAKDDDATTSTEVEDKENGVDLLDSIKDTAKGTADGQSDGTDDGQASSGTKGNNITGDNLPSKQVGGDSVKSATVETDVDNAAEKTSSSLNSLFSANFLDAIAGMATDLRDKLYVADYAMSMFTYDTIENEYKVENDKTSVEAGALLSLTKCDLSTNNNYAYGAEVEYIIYGGENGSNLTKAYGSIYGIRLGFNLIYAFATSEIRDSALAIATPISAATLGVIPVPLIQAAIIIALACCESAIDLVDIRAGYQIPLYKSKKTWVCSVSGLTQQAKKKVGSIVREHGEKAIDAGLNKLNGLLDMTDEELNNLLDAEKDEIIESLESTYDQLITENANIVIQEVTMLVNSAIEETRLREAEESYETKKSEALAWVKSELETQRSAFAGKEDLPSLVQYEALGVLIDNSDTLLSSLFDTMEDTVYASEAGAVIDNILSVPDQVEGEIAELGGAIMAEIDEIREFIADKITYGSSAIGDYKTQKINDIKTAMGEGADELKTALNDYVDKVCGGGDAGGDEGVATASFCSFAYSDYMRLFMLIGLYANEEKTVLRIGDVIQTNMAKCIKEEDDYALALSSTYVKISAEIQVKPTFMALPLFADVENNPNNNEAWYTIQYNGIAGY